MLRVLEVLEVHLALVLGLAPGLAPLLQDVQEVQEVLEELARMVLLVLEVQVGSTTMFPLRSPQGPKHQTFASASRGPSSCDVLVRARTPELPLHPSHC